MLHCPRCNSALINDEKNDGCLICLECRKRFNKEKVKSYWDSVSDEDDRIHENDSLDASVGPQENDQRSDIAWMRSEPQNEDEKRKATKANIIIATITITFMLIIGGANIYSIITQEQEPGVTYEWNDDNTVDLYGRTIVLGKTTIGEVLDSGWELSKPDMALKNISAGSEQTLLYLTRTEQQDNKTLRLNVGVCNPWKKSVAFNNAIINRINIDYFYDETETDPDIPQISLQDGVTLGKTTMKEAIEIYGTPLNYTEKNDLVMCFYNNHKGTKFLELSSNGQDKPITHVSIHISKDAVKAQQ